MAKRTLLVLIFSTTLMLLAMPGADAYIDPGSGSMIIQAVVGVFAAIATGLVVFWARIKGFFHRHEKPEADDN